MENFSKKISNLFLWIMNIGLLTVGILLSFGLLIELKEIVVEGMKFITDTGSYQHFIEEIYSWNLDSQKLYTNLGFKPFKEAKNGMSYKLIL